MPAHKVKFRAVPYTGPSGPEVAFRGMVVNFTPDDAKRLLALGALVDPDVELDRPGKIIELGATPSEEDLVNWVLGATEAEFDEAITKRPALEIRLLEAREHVTNRWEHHNAAIQAGLRDGTEPDADGGASQGDQDADADGGTSGTPADTSGDAGNDLGGPGDASTGTTDTNTDEDDELAAMIAEQSDAVVAENVEFVTDYLSKHPDEAADILAAEVRRANADPTKPIRVGVQRSVEAAAGHTG